MRTRDFWAMVSPSLLVMFALLVFPLYQTLRWSFERVNYGQAGTFVGFANYEQALTDPRFGRAVAFTVGITVVVVAVLVGFGYVLAVLVNRLRRARPWVLGILLVSYVIPQLVGATMFSWLFDENFGGIVNLALSELTGTEILWFTDPWANRVVIALDVIWFLLPFSMLVILAGLQGVPEDVVEASRIDGASRFQVHWHVIIPSIRGVLGFATLISIMDVLRLFDPLVALSPQAVQIGNESIMLYIYNAAFREGGQQLGLGSAINVLLIMLILVLLAPLIRQAVREGKPR